MIRPTTLALATLGLSMASSVSASAWELRSFPHCDDGKVIAKIVHRFNWAEHHTWKRGFGIESVQRARQRRVEDRGPIPRRYCRGHAILSNGRHPTVHYLIEGGQGLAGTGFNVEFCVNGHDPWRTYDGSCRVLRR
jgi:hypothetical protein